MWYLTNEAFALGEKISKSKLVWKIVRSLTNRFHPKVTAIKESKNLDRMKVILLIGFSIKSQPLKKVRIWIEWR